ncbi:MAG: hypothetical protein WC121_03475 [Candidatus Kapaibacterium sp.]|jgi:hypothetical protein
MSPLSLWLDLCNNNLPPCKNSPPFVVTLETPICWKILLDYQDLQDSTNNIYLNIPCDDDAYCEVEHKYCKDKYGVKHHTTGSYMGYNFDPECTLESHEITRPVVLHGESECFKIYTPCND